MYTSQVTATAVSSGLQSGSSPQQKGMGRDDYIIICGDHGDVWAGEQADDHHLNWLEDKPFTTLFVDGNHENFDLLSVYADRFPGNDQGTMSIQQMVLRPLPCEPGDR